MHEIELIGLDGGNLLAYLAALGTLRVLTLAEPEAEVRMSWVDRGWWMPVVHHSRISTGEDLVGVLEQRITPLIAVQPRKKSKKERAETPWKGERVKALQNANRAFSRDLLDVSLADFRKELETETQEPEQREVADFLASLGSDCFAANKNGDEPATTKFRAIGAGNNEGFLGFMRTIHLETKAGQLHNALFVEWDYSDPPPFMRWDPNEYRPHALRAEDPAKDRERNNVRGANRLAIEALPLFPTAPSARRLETTGFDRDEITWPIWIAPLNVNTIASLVASEEVKKADRATMSHRGIVQVFRAKRFTEGKYRNFSPAKAVL
jgi:hypothetical protein